MPGWQTDAEVGEIVSIAIADAFDNAVNMQAFEQPSRLTGIQVLQSLTEAPVGEATDSELAANQGT